MVSFLNYLPLDVREVLLFLAVALYFLWGRLPPWLQLSREQQPEAHSGRRLTIKDVPGPKALPLLGTYWLFSLFGPYKLSEMHIFFKDMFEQYGPIVRVEALHNIPVIHIKDRKAIQSVMAFPSRCPVRPPTEVVSFYRRTRPDRYCSLGMVNEQGERWSHLRHSLTPSLMKKSTLINFAPELDSVAENFIRLLRDHMDPTDKVSNFMNLSKRLGLEATCTVILGRRLGFLEQQTSPLTTRLAEVVEAHFRACRDTQFGLPFWKWLPTKAYSDLKKAEEEYYDIISELLEMTAEDEERQAEPVRSVFMSIMNASNIDQLDKKSALIDFIASGIQTMGNTLVFLLYLVAKHPEVQERMYEEFTTVLPNDSPLTPDVIKRMVYLDSVIKESYRIQPTALCVARILEKDMELSGYHLASGSVVLCHDWLACLDESNFPDAKSFRPERWMPGNEAMCENRDLVKPYGFGTRICPGEKLVDYVLRVVLAKMVRSFHLEFEGEIGKKFEFLLVPSGTVEFTLKSRN